MVCNFL